MVQQWARLTWSTLGFTDAHSYSSSSWVLSRSATPTISATPSLTRSSISLQRSVMCSRTFREELGNAGKARNRAWTLERPSSVKATQTNNNKNNKQKHSNIQQDNSYGIIWYSRIFLTQKSLQNCEHRWYEKLLHYHKLLHGSKILLLDTDNTADTFYY